MGADLIGDKSWALRSPSLAGETCQLQIVFAMGYVEFSSVTQSCLTLCNACTAALQASLPFSNSRSLLKLMSIKSVMLSNCIILCHPLLLLPSIFPSNWVFPNESVLYNNWPKYWSFRFRFNSSNEYSELISFSIDCLDLLAVQGTLKRLVQHHSSRASILHRSPLIMVQLSHPYMPTGKIIALITLNSFSKVMSLLLKILGLL